MSAKIGRSARVVVTNDVGAFSAETIAGRGLRISFDVVKSLSFEANRAQVEITNLSKVSRDRISGVVKRVVAFTSQQRQALLVAGESTAPAIVTDTALGIAHVQLFAGYGLALGQIFEGDSQTITHDHSGVDWLTTLDSGDSLTRMREGTIDRSYAPGTPVITTIVDVAHAMGLLVLGTTLAALTAAIGPAIHVYGFHAQGAAWPILQELLNVLVTAEFPFTWSVQDGQLILLASNQTIPLPPLEVNAGTGMIGSPRRLEAGAVEVDMLLDPGCIPGRQVQLTSRDVTGLFRVDRVRMVGDTYGEGPFACHAQLSDFLEGILA